MNQLVKSLFFVLALINSSVVFSKDYKPEDFQINQKPSHFFPGGIYSNFEINWYSKHLTALNEPSLFENSKATFQQTYRFLWLRTFHHPISIRLTVNEDGTGELAVKMTNGAGGYQPGILITNEVLKVTKPQVLHFLMKIDLIGFWDMKPKTGIAGLDGARWILEGVQYGKYHLIDRWTSDTKEIREPALVLIHLAKLKVIEVY